MPCAGIARRRPPRGNDLPRGVVGAGVPKGPIPEQYIQILERPNPAVMATVDGAGAPVSVATWYLWEDGRLLVNLAAERKRLEHLYADPRLSLTVLDGDSWYRHISLRGVATLSDDPDSSVIDRISRHYSGQPYRLRDQKRVSAWVDVDTYHVWGFDR